MVADGATAASVRTGAGGAVTADGAVDAASDVTDGTTADGAATSAAEPGTTSHAAAAPAPTAARWCTGLMGIGADEVRLGVAVVRATTRPAGAAGEDSWPSCGMIDGRPW
jgi:hypothetical protein